MSRLLKFVAVALASAAGLCGGAKPGMCQDAVLAALMPLSINQIFDRVDSTLTKAINQAQDAGNGLLMSVTNRTMLLEQDAILAVGGQREKAFRDLDAPTQQLLLEMEKWRMQAADFQNAAYTIEQTASLDLTYNLQSLPFTHVPPFFVQGIDGTAFLKHPGGYKVVLHALNLGIQPDRFKSDVSIELDHKPVQIDTPDQSKINQATITLPNAILDAYFQQDHVRIVPLVIKVTQHRFTRKFLGLAKNEDVETYQVPTTLTLYPALAANVTLTVSYPHYDWAPVADVPGDFSAETPNKDGCRADRDPNCAYHGSVDLTVPSSQANPPHDGDERITGFRLDCSGGNGCAYAYMEGENPIYAAGSRVVVKFQTSSLPVKVRVIGKVQRYTRRPQDDTTTLKSTVYFGQNSQLVVPGDFTDLTMHVTSFTGQRSDFDLVKQTDPLHLVTQISTGDPNSPTRTVVFTAAPPPS